MNLSGGAVLAAMKYYGAPEEIVVIYDDMDLPEGKIRIRKGGRPEDIESSTLSKP